MATNLHTARRCGGDMSTTGERPPVLLAGEGGAAHMRAGYRSPRSGPGLLLSARPMLCPWKIPSVA